MFSKSGTPYRQIQQTPDFRMHSLLRLPCLPVIDFFLQKIVVFTFSVRSCLSLSLPVILKPINVISSFHISHLFLGRDLQIVQAPLKVTW